MSTLWCGANSCCLISAKQHTFSQRNPQQIFTILLSTKTVNQTHTGTWCYLKTPQNNSIMSFKEMLVNTGRSRDKNRLANYAEFLADKTIQPQDTQAWTYCSCNVSLKFVQIS